MSKYLGADDPLSETGKCINRMITDHFTCPACYRDLPLQEGIHKCECGAVVRCANEEPDYLDSVARLIALDEVDLYLEEIEAAGIEVPEDV